MIKHKLQGKIYLTAFLMSVALCSAHAFSATKDEITSKEEPDGFSYKFGGKIQLRAESYDDLFSNNGDREAAYYVRRAEFSVDGRLMKSLNYEIKLKSDYEGNVILRDAYISYDLTKRSEILVGRFDPDFGLELSGSNSWTTANERSSIWDLVKNAGDGSDGGGLAFRTAQKHFFVSLGGFDFSDSKVLNARASYMPINERNEVLHLGYSVRQARYDSVDYGVIRTDLGVWGVHVLDNGNSTRLARDSRGFGFNDDLTQVAELAYLHGPFSIQGEFLDRKFNGAKGDEDRSAKGNYVQFAYTITGESRSYSTKSATFGKIKPAHKYGAWELFYRQENLDTDGEAGMLSHGRHHGEASSQVAGVNWYLMDYAKISANYILGDAPLIPNDVGDEKGKAVSLQLQLRF